MLQIEQVEIFTFDCYGTLIDWENGIRNAFSKIHSLSEVNISALVRSREEEELIIEQGPFFSYDVVLAMSLQNAAQKFGISIPDRDARLFATSISEWPSFPDVKEFLSRIRTTGKPLAILSNVNRQAIHTSVQTLGIPFQHILTADDVQSYKPAPAHWLRLRSQLNIKSQQQLHIAASLAHDIVPCTKLKIPTVWINRKMEALPENAKPTLITQDLLELAEKMNLPPKSANL